MFPSIRLLEHACRITLFTRANCQLCVNAKQTLSNVWDARPFEYRELDVMTPGGKSWRDLYEFDTPVIHVSRAKEAEEVPAMAGKAKKLMHRFTEGEVKAKMDATEAGA